MNRQFESKEIAAFMAAFSFVADILTKFIIKKSLALGAEVVIVKGFFSIVHVHNTGVAFSIFGKVPPNIINPILITVNSAVLLFLLVMLFRNDNPIKPRAALGLITGGAAGNLVDRIANGYVTDFLDFQAWGYHWPAFNLADAFITLGIALFLIYTFRGNSRRTGG